MNIETYLNSLVKNKIVIFLLHGVIKKNPHKIRNYNRKHITKSEFNSFIKGLSKVGTPVSIGEILKIRNGKKMPQYPFAITFDDGFRNNLSLALPILVKYEVPATIYITTDFIDRNRMSWIDRIEWAFEKKKTIKIDLPWRKNKTNISSVKKKIELLEEIRLFIKKNKYINPNTFADSVQTSLNLPLKYSGQSDLDRKLSWSEVSFLSSHSSITIGGHTHNHLILSHLNKDELNYEIGKSLSLIKKNTGKRVQHYSYPEGLDYTYNKKVIYHLKNKGIICCPSAQHGINSIKTSPFKLKRITVI